MKNFRLKTVGLFAMTLMSLFFFSCDDKDDSIQSEGSSRLMVKLTDAPGDYDEVNIEVLDVLIKSDSDESDEKGWVSVGNPEMVGEGKIYDLLKLTGGANVLLTNELIPAGKLGQMRLVLGDENTVVVDGIEYDLDTPSAQQSGLKLKINQTLMPDITYNFLLDFQVDKSIVSEGKEGKFSLKPTIKVSTEAASGVIKGQVDPEFDFQAEASVIVDGETITAYTDEDGFFQLNGVPAGTYDLTLTPDPASGVTAPIIISVEVVNGEITTIAEPIKFL